MAFMRKLAVIEATDLQTITPAEAEARITLAEAYHNALD